MKNVNYIKRILEEINKIYALRKELIIKKVKTAEDAIVKKIN